MNRPNFIKLANYLFGLPNNYEYFCMTDFAANGSNQRKRRSIKFKDVIQSFNESNICRCAAGMAPLAGIEILETDRNWRDYLNRVFEIDIDKPEYFWCFSAHWWRIDDTPHGAAARILYLLIDGLPQDYKPGKEYSEFKKCYQKYIGELKTNIEKLKSEIDI